MFPRWFRTVEQILVCEISDDHNCNIKCTQASVCTQSYKYGHLPAECWLEVKSKDSWCPKTWENSVGCLVLETRIVVKVCHLGLHLSQLKKKKKRRLKNIKKMAQADKAEQRQQEEKKSKASNRQSCLLLPASPDYWMVGQFLQVSL